MPMVCTDWIEYSGDFLPARLCGGLSKVGLHLLLHSTAIDATDQSANM